MVLNGSSTPGGYIHRVAEYYSEQKPRAHAQHPWAGVDAAEEDTIKPWVSEGDREVCEGQWYMVAVRIARSEESGRWR